MTKSTVTSTRRFVGLFLAITLTVPTPAFALRMPENAEAKGGLEELESALRNPSDPGRAAATVLVRQLVATLGLPAAQPAPVPAAGLEESITIHTEPALDVSPDLYGSNAEYSGLANALTVALWKPPDQPISDWPITFLRYLAADDPVDLHAWHQGGPVRFSGVSLETRDGGENAARLLGMIARGELDLNQVLDDLSRMWTWMYAARTDAKALGFIDGEIKSAISRARNREFRNTAGLEEGGQNPTFEIPNVEARFLPQEIVNNILLKLLRSPWPHGDWETSGIEHVDLVMNNTASKQSGSLRFAADELKQNPGNAMKNVSDAMIYVGIDPTEGGRWLLRAGGNRPADSSTLNVEVYLSPAAGLEEVKVRSWAQKTALATAGFIGVANLPVNPPATLSPQQAVASSDSSPSTQSPPMSREALVEALRGYKNQLEILGKQNEKGEYLIGDEVVTKIKEILRQLLQVPKPYELSIVLDPKTGSAFGTENRLAVQVLFRKEPRETLRVNLDFPSAKDIRSGKARLKDDPRPIKGFIQEVSKITAQYPFPRHKIYQAGLLDDGTVVIATEPADDTPDYYGSFHLFVGKPGKVEEIKVEGTDRLRDGGTTSIDGDRFRLYIPNEGGRAGTPILYKGSGKVVGKPVSTFEIQQVDVKKSAGLEERVPVSELVGFVVRHAIHNWTNKSTTQILYLTYLGQQHPIQLPGAYYGVQVAVQEALSALSPTGIVEATVDYANQEIRLSVPALLDEFEGGPLRENVPEPSPGEVEERNLTDAYGIIQGLRTRGRVEVRFPGPRRGFSNSILLDPLERPLNLGRVDLEEKSIQLRKTLVRFADPVSGQVKFRVGTGKDPIVVTLLRPDTGTPVTNPPGGGPFHRPSPSSGPGEIQERLPIPPGVDDLLSPSRIGGPASDGRQPDDIELPVGQQVPAGGLEEKDRVPLGPEIGALVARVGSAEETEKLIGSTASFVSGDEAAATQLLAQGNAVANVRGIPRRIESFWAGQGESRATEPRTTSLPVYVQRVEGVPPVVPDSIVSSMVDQKWNLKPWREVDQALLERLKEFPSGTTQAMFLVNPVTAEWLKDQLGWDAPVVIIAIQPGALDHANAFSTMEYLLNVIEQANRLGRLIYHNLEGAIRLQNELEIYLFNNV